MFERVREIKRTNIVTSTLLISSIVGVSGMAKEIQPQYTSDIISPRLVLNNPHAFRYPITVDAVVTEGSQGFPNPDSAKTIYYTFPFTKRKIPIGTEQYDYQYIWRLCDWYKKEPNGEYVCKSKVAPLVVSYFRKHDIYSPTLFSHPLIPDRYDTIKKSGPARITGKVTCAMTGCIFDATSINWKEH